MKIWRLEDIVAMYLLPALLQPLVIRDKVRQSWKPSIAEAQEAFILYAKDSVNKQVLFDQKKKYQSILRPIQPCVVIVGEAIHMAKDVYGVFDNLAYKTSTILAALDTCFKIFHVMNLEYPPEAYNTWILFQRFFL